MKIVGDPNAATLTPATTTLANLSHAAGAFHQVPCLRVIGQLANDVLTLCFGQQLIRHSDEFGQFGEGLHR